MMPCLVRRIKLMKCITLPAGPAREIPISRSVVWDAFLLPEIHLQEFSFLFFQKNGFFGLLYAS